MIHGNSSAGAIFAPQLEGEIGRNWRVIAPDLPGHGQSGDALDPDRSYSMEGYADAMTEVLTKLGISEAVVFGWSLGGHIGIEMISRFPGMRGLMITGTPPVAREEVGQGFKSGPDMALAGQEIFSTRDVESYARSTCGEPLKPRCSISSPVRTDARDASCSKICSRNRRQPARYRCRGNASHSRGQRARRAVCRTRFRLEGPFRQSVGR